MQRLFSIGRPLPGISLIFLVVALVAMLQLPANLIMKSVSLSGGIIFNEIVIIAGLPFVIAIFIGFDKKKLFPLQSPKKSTWIWVALLSIPAALLIDYATAASESIFPPPQQFQELLERLMSFEGIQGFFWKFLVLCIVPGICEELLFRGFCQTSIEARWGTNKAIIITAFLFAILHGNPWYIHLYLILGFFLSWVYAVGRTLWIPITCHIINNAWTFTNHALGVEYPLRGFGNPTDLIIISSAIVLVIVLGVGYERSVRQIEKRAS